MTPQGKKKSKIFLLVAKKGTTVKLAKQDSKEFLSEKSELVFISSLWHFVQCKLPVCTCYTTLGGSQNVAQ